MKSLGFLVQNRPNFVISKIEDLLSCMIVLASSQSWSKVSASSESEVCVSELRQEFTPWRLPQSSTSISEGESDQELQNFIMMRNQADKDTEVRHMYAHTLCLQMVFGLF